MASQAEPHSR